MINPIKVYDFNNHGNTSKDFFIWQPEINVIGVTSFEDGIIKIKPMYRTSIYTFAEVVVDLFEPNSNFINKVKEAFGYPDDASFVGITFEFNGVTIVVTKENADAKMIYEEYEKIMEERREEYRRKKEAYLQSTNYYLQRAKELKAKYRNDTIQKEITTIEKSTTLSFRDEDASKEWEKLIDENLTDMHKLDIIVYASRWGKYMQHLMSKHGKTVADIASNAANLCNTSDITGFQYGCAVALLSIYWKYGEELRVWHNKVYGVKDEEGIAFPTILDVW